MRNAPSLVTESPAMRQLDERLGVLARGEAPVLVSGARGTGKERVARILHARGPRARAPFVVLDASTLGARMRASLEEDEADRDEWFRQADGGTLVLDGIEALTPLEQAQLLRLVDEPFSIARRSAGFRPLGVRLVTLTRLSRDELARRVATERLSESLYYRLNGVHLHVPSLAERREDLFGLAADLLFELAPALPSLPSIAPSAWRVFASHAFPGNVRELRWMLEHALAMADGGPIEAEHLPFELPGVRAVTGG